MRLTFLAAIATTALAACTTVEGTNAMVDPLTFEREVMRTTLQGVGVVPTEEKPMISGERSPLVIPGSGATPPPPSQSAAVIPEDSTSVTLDTSGLTTADLDALRGGRVVSSGATSGRPLTEAEARQLAARMASYRNAQGAGERSIYLPPESYFQTVGGQQTICQAPNGALVAPTDPSCPPDVRAALAAQQ
ncbi:hypothetical protein [Pelagibacterium sp. H642]|uniref:hypothetical protein n=1 Tax=Pelagibacterium sp. H642 TaxID=1881069 RepID=UPI0028159A15|nr:hypothetical protein [Pelagibacterium sp. H642]WMT91418.1 hypothetical protein NO934_03900 [Pelagibacterium sp. H642]